VLGPAAARLLQEAEGADLLVVGSRGLGGFRDLLLGSVSQHCLHHAGVPVAVVHGEVPEEPADPEGIVVGIDGSATAQHALAWALDEARLRGAAVHVVHAWNVAPVYSPYVAYGEATGVLEDAAHVVISDPLADADVSGLPSTVVRTVRCGSAAGAILDAAADADLVVLGSRGRGGFTGLLLGSVTHQVTHHARCPVVVLPSAS